MPSLAGVSTSFAPSACSSARRSRLIDSGMASVSRYPLAAATNARAMPVFPLVGSMMCGLGVKRPALLGGLDHGPPDPVLDAGQRIEELELDEHRRLLGGMIRLSRTRGVLKTVCTIS